MVYKTSITKCTLQPNGLRNGVPGQHFKTTPKEPKKRTGSKCDCIYPTSKAAIDGLVGIPGNETLHPTNV